MKSFGPQIARFRPATTIAAQAPRLARPFATTSTMASSESGNLKIENTNINTASGVTLKDEQKTLIGSVLDLFAGRPSLPKLRLWKDDATFSDPLTIAQGRDKYSAQWYGLQAAFSSIERLSHQVTSSGNPIEMDLKTKYVVKGLGSEQVIESKILIHTEGDKITKVEDKWNGKIPEGPFATALRNINAVTVPYLVKVPKNDEEDKKLGNQ